MTRTFVTGACGLLIVLIVLGVGPAAHAGGGVLWGPAGGVGDLADPANWVGGVLPGPGDSVVFDTPGGSTMGELSLPALSVSGISIVSGDTTFDLGGGTFAGDAALVGTGGGAAGVWVLDGTLSVASLDAGDGAGSDVSVVVGAGGAVTVAGALATMSDAAVSLDGGVLTAGSLALANAIDFQSGGIVVNGDLAWADLGSPAGITLGAGDALTVAQAFTPGAAGALTLDGGALSAESLAPGGALAYLSGDLTVTGGSLSVGAGQHVAGPVALGGGDVWDISDTLETASGASMTLDGGSVTAQMLNNAGAYLQNGGTTTLDTLTNTATGTFTLNGGTLTVGAVTGNAGGVSMTGPATFRLTGQDFEVGAGEAFGAAFTVAEGGLLRIDQDTWVGASSPGTLTLEADATLLTGGLVVSGDTTINRHATSDIRANQVSNLGTIGLDTVAGWGIQPWTLSSATLVNNGTLTHNTSATTTTAMRLTSDGTLEVGAGTVVLDYQNVGFDWTTANDIEIAAGAELAILGTFESFGDFSELTLAGSAMIGNDGTLRLTDQHLTLRGTYTGTGRLVMEQDARLSLDPGNNPITIHDLTASGSPTIRRAAGTSGVVEVSVLRSDGSNAFFGQDVAVTYVEDVLLTGGGARTGFTNLGLLRLAPGAEVSEFDNLTAPSGPMVWENAAGATIRLGDGARLTPTVHFTNNGRIEVVDQDAGYVEVVSVLGTGTFDVGGGTLEIRGSLDSTQQTFNGDAGSLTILGLGGGTGTALHSGLTFDTDGDLWLRSSATFLRVETPLDVGGSLIVSARNSFTFDSQFATVDLNDVLTETHSGTWYVQSGQQINMDSLSVMGDVEAGSPGVLRINNEGVFNIGAGGVLAGTLLNVEDSGTTRIMGHAHLRELRIEEGLVELYGGLSDGDHDDEARSIYLQSGGSLTNMAGSVIDTPTISGSAGSVVINHGLIEVNPIDENFAEWAAFELRNFGEVRVASGQGLYVRHMVGTTNQGTLTIEAGGTFRAEDFSQSAGATFTAHGATLLFEGGSDALNIFEGTVDFAGSTTTIRGRTEFLPGTNVVSLGSIETWTLPITIVGRTGQALPVENLALNGRVDTEASNTDAVHVSGLLTSAENAYISLPTVVSGTVSPGLSPSDNYHRLWFRRGLTLETGATLALDIESASNLDSLLIASNSALVIESGVTLDLNISSAASPLAVGTQVRLVDTSRPIVGTFDTVTGLDHGDGAWWRLIYDGNDLFAQVQLAGDIDGDGFVGAADLDLLLAQWGDGLAAGTGADLSGDGLIGQPDLDIVQAHWGAGTPSGPDVPEPGSLLLLGGGVLLAYRRRR